MSNRVSIDGCIEASRGSILTPELACDRPAQELPREGPPPSRHPPLQAPEVTREWPADGPTSSPSAPTGWYLAVTSSLAISIVFASALFPGLLEGPVLCKPIELASALLGAVLVWLLLGLADEEGRLNAGGETMLPR